MDAKVPHKLGGCFVGLALNRGAATDVGPFQSSLPPLSSAVTAIPKNLPAPLCESGLSPEIRK